MGKILTSLLLASSLLITPILKANHSIPEVKPFQEIEYSIPVMGEKVVFGKYEMFKIFDNPSWQWDYFEYTPLCNGEYGHPFFTFNRVVENGWLIFYDFKGNKIKEMGAKQTNDLPPLFIHQKEYNCPIRKKI